VNRRNHLSSQKNAPAGFSTDGGVSNQRLQRDRDVISSRNRDLSARESVRQFDAYFTVQP